MFSLLDFSSSHLIQLGCYPCHRLRSLQEIKFYLPNSNEVTEERRDDQILNCYHMPEASLHHHNHTARWVSEYFFTSKKKKEVYRSKATYPRSHSQEWRWKFSHWPSIHIWWALLPWNTTHLFYCSSSCSPYAMVGSKNWWIFQSGSEISDYSPR